MTTSPSTLPPPTTIPSLPTPARAALLDTLFEPSPALHALALPLLDSLPFPTYEALIASIGAALHALASSPSPTDTARLHDVLASHPRLGAAKVDSAQSAAEQAQLQRGSAEEAEKLQRLNAEYEARFPGLRYVVSVNGRGRDVVMEDMRRRIDGGSLEGEREAAIRAMCEIAVNRAAKLAR